MNTLNKFIEQANFSNEDLIELEKIMEDKKLRGQILNEVWAAIMGFLSAKRKGKIKRKEKLATQSKIGDIYKKIKQQ